MTRVQKSYPMASFKALPQEGEGTFEAVVSVFGNVDLQGDRVMPGAFEKSIAKWQKRGDPVPVLWSHDWADPYAHIGYVDPQDMKEVPANQKAGFGGGLYVKGHLDVHKPFAKQVYDLLAERRVTEHSFSYDIPPGGEMRGKDGANELHTVDLIELGPTLKGANPATMTLGTKSDGDDEADRRIKLRLDRAHDDELRLELEKASWNGDAAMGSCHSAADYRKIAFERANDSDPDTAAHWALPHHSSPGADANPAGVSAALGALNGARGGAPDLKNKAAAESHLQAHAGASKAEEPELPEKVGEKTGRVVGAKAMAALKDALAGAVDSWASDMNGTADGEKFADNQPRDSQGRWTDTGAGDGRLPGGSRPENNPAMHGDIRGTGVGDGRLADGTWPEDGVMPGTSITPDHARSVAAAERKHQADELAAQGLGERLRGGTGSRTDGQVADMRVIVGPDGSVVDSSTDYNWAKEVWRSAPAGSVLVEPDGTVREGNGTTHPPKAAPEPGDKKDFAKGYADGTTGREKSETPTEEYLRGYEDGQTERAAVENQEIAQFNEIISGLKTT